MGGYFGPFYMWSTEMLILLINGINKIGYKGRLRTAAYFKGNGMNENQVDEYLRYFSIDGIFFILFILIYQNYNVFYFRMNPWLWEKTK